MYKKLLTTLFLIILLIFTFTISSYASTKYSFLRTDGNYDLEISFKEQTHLDLPDFHAYLAFESPDIHFFLVKFSYEADITHNLYISQTPFIVSKKNSSSITFTNTDGSSIRCYNYNAKSGYFSANHSSSTVYYSLSDEIIMSSDNITDGNEVISYTYSKSPLVRTTRTFGNMNVLSEVISILPVVLTVVIGILAIKKAYSFIKNKLRNA